MGGTMKVGTESSHYHRRDRVAEALARRLDILPSAARQVLVGQLNWRVAAVIASFNDVNEFERREAWMAPIRAAMDGLAFEANTRELRIRAEQADAEEEIADRAFREDPSPLNRDRLIRAKMAQSTTSLAEAMALINERRQEGRMTVLKIVFVVALWCVFFAGLWDWVTGRTRGLPNWGDEERPVTPEEQLWLDLVKQHQKKRGAA